MTQRIELRRPLDGTSPDDKSTGMSAVVRASLDHLQRAVAGASRQRPEGAPATSLLTEDLNDTHDNCLDRAVTWADAGRHQLVFMDATDGGPGHVLIQDKATGRVWDVNDGPPPLDASTWRYASAGEWAWAQTATQPGSATRRPLFEVAGTLQVSEVRALLALAPAERAAAIAASGDPMLIRLEAAEYAMAARFPPVIRVISTTEVEVGFTFGNTLGASNLPGYVPETPMSLLGLDRTELVLYHLMYGPGSGSEASMEARNAWSQLSPTAQVLYCAYLYSVSDSQANLQGTIYGANGAPNVAVSNPPYTLNQYLNAVEYGGGVFHAAAGAEFDPNWKPWHDDNADQDDPNGPAASRVVSGSGADTDADDHLSGDELYDYSVRNGGNLTRAEAHTLVALYSRSDSAAGVTAEEVSQMMHEGVLSIPPPAFGSAGQPRFDLGAISAERVTSAVVFNGDINHDGMLSADELNLGLWRVSGVDWVIPPEQLQALVSHYSGGGTAVNAAQVGQMVIDGAVQPDAGEGAITARPNASVAGELLSRSGDDQVLDGTELEAAFAPAPGAVGGTPPGAVSTLLGLVSWSESIFTRTELSVGPAGLDALQIEQLVRVGVITRGADGSLAIDLHKLDLEVGKAIVAAYGNSADAIDNNGSLDVTEFGAALAQFGIECTPGQAGWLHSTYGHDGVVGAEDLARMFDDGVLTLSADGRVALNVEALVIQGVAQPYAAQAYLLQSMYLPPTTAVVLRDVLAARGAEIDEAGAQSLLDHYERGGVLDTAAMVADGVLVYNPQTDRLEVRLDAMPLDAIHLLRVAEDPATADGQLNRDELAVALNASGANYSPQDLDGLVQFYRSNATGDVVTADTLQQAIDDGVIAKDPSTGVITVNWSRVPPERVAASLMADRGDQGGEPYREGDPVLMNRMGLANALNATIPGHSTYSKLDVDALIRDYGGDTGVVTEVQLAQMVADGVFTDGSGGDTRLVSESGNGNPFFTGFEIF